MSTETRKKRTYGPGYAPREEDETKCIEAVHEKGRGMMSWQCYNKRGHGPEGLYCKTHSKEHLGEGEPIRTIYRVTRFNSVEAIEVFDESEKFIYRRFASGGRTRREEKTAHDYSTKREALEEIVRRRQKQMEQAEMDLKKALEDLSRELG